MFTIENNCVSVTKGDSGFIAICVKNPDGTEYEVRDDDTLVFSVRKKLSSGEVVLQKEGAEFELSPEETALPTGKYYYDVMLIRKGGQVQTIIEPESFTVEEAAHII